MDAVKNLLGYIYENWATIAAIFALAFAIYQKARKSWADWQAKSAAEKEAEFEEAQRQAIEEAKKALNVIILSLCSEMEKKWNESGSGAIRRSEVLSIIFEKYPVLLTVTDQDELISYIDNLIDTSLDIVRKTIRTEAVATNV